jgi:hypothetical protein
MLYRIQNFQNFQAIQSNQTINISTKLIKQLIMKKQLLFMVLGATLFGSAANAQDTIKTTGDAPLVISGSVDTYWKTDFSGHANIPTSFANENNSVSIGMIDLGLKKSVGNVSFVGELSFSRNLFLTPIPAWLLYQIPVPQGWGTPAITSRIYTCRIT